MPENKIKGEKKKTPLRKGFWKNGFEREKEG